MHGVSCCDVQSDAVSSSVGGMCVGARAITFRVWWSSGGVNVAHTRRTEWYGSQSCDDRLMRPDLCTVTL